MFDVEGKGDPVDQLDQPAEAENKDAEPWGPEPTFIRQDVTTMIIRALCGDGNAWWRVVEVADHSQWKGGSRITFAAGSTVETSRAVVVTVQVSGE